MKDKFQDSDAPQEAVQDYLDMLLSRATEKPEAAVDVTLEARDPVKPVRVSQLDERVGSKRERDSSFSQTPLSIVVSASAKPKLTTQPSQKPVFDGSNIKPFAEPAKPLNLKIPLPRKEQVQAAPIKEAAPVEVKAPVEEPEIEPVTEDNTEQQELSNEGAEALTANEAAFEPTQWLENGRPSWAQNPFECLLFSVGGLTLAVPLAELGTIYPISEELTPIFGQIDWFMGLMPIKEGNLRTVNTAKVVMPERYQESMVEKFTYVISINGVSWGLAVDTVSTAITLDPDAVRWRSERTSRPWLAGTVIEQMCALLDISQLAVMFAEQDSSSAV